MSNSYAAAEAALAVISALLQCLSEMAARQLQLHFEWFRRATVGEGRPIEVRYVDPEGIEVGDRGGYADATVFGGDVLSGAMSMEADPAQRQVAP